MPRFGAAACAFFDLALLVGLLGRCGIEALCRGDWMGGRLSRLDRCRIARGCAVIAACFVLSSCSGQLTSSNAKYSQRVVEEDEPVSKGGGQHRVGGPYNAGGRDHTPVENKTYRAEGMASWYGRDFHGRPTANREVYDMHSISAAHPTMPLPSYARVTNLENGRSIIVRVNNRGPYSRGRIVDLSVGTAKALDFYSKGLAKVRVEYVGRAPIEGSDDRMLMATLREGSPAPAPSKVMVASAKPFIPNLADRAAAQEPERAVASTGRAPTGSILRSPAPTAAETGARAPPPPSGSRTGFAATGSEGSLLGLMSGRGLY
jgi:rare lipoprotein A (peptidoglycan hydrolase)